MKTIGFYMPQWLYRSDVSDRMFADEFVKTVDASERYRVLPLDLPNLALSSTEEAAQFCKRSELVLVVEHDSPYYCESRSYAKTNTFLGEQVPFVNSFSSHEVGHNKLHVKRVLREKNIPVLDDLVTESLSEMQDYLREDELYVVKPLDRGAGAGVRLIKRQTMQLLEYREGEWRAVIAHEGEKGIRLQRPLGMSAAAPLMLMLLAGILVMIRESYLLPFAALAAMLALYLFLHTYDRGFNYSPMLIEPYFNDSETEFTSLRATVIGDEVVEAIRRVNGKNITSNVSSGGKATKVELTGFQKEIAVAAAKAIGADYAGVDLLVRGSESVIGEVNIGPISVFGAMTGVNVGKLLGEYVIRKCDELTPSLPADPRRR